MKNSHFLLAFGFCFVTLVCCIAFSQNQKPQFVEVGLSPARLGPHELEIWAGHRLTNNELMALGTDTIRTTYVMYLFDEDSNRVINKWDLEDYGSLYELRTASHILLLWEVEGEYFSWLPLYVFNLKNKQLAYAGDFKVSLEVDYYAEYTPYAVQDINIESSDTTFTFKFTKKLSLNPGEDDSKVADSLIYELDLRTNELRVAELWTTNK